MSKILKKTIYFTLFQIILWFLIASIQGPAVYSRSLTVKHYIILTLLFDATFIYGLLQTRKRDLKALSLRRLNAHRSLLFLYLIATAVSLYLQSTAIMTFMIFLVADLLRPVYSDSNYWCCPECGKRYGIRIWFLNQCPWCGQELEKQGSNRVI